MSLYWIIYLASISDNIKCITCVAFTLSIVAIIANVVMIAENCIKLSNKVITITIILSIFSIVNLMLTVLIPSKETIYLLAASKYTQDVIDNPKVQVLEDKILNILNEKLDSISKK